MDCAGWLGQLSVVVEQWSVWVGRPVICGCVLLESNMVWLWAGMHTGTWRLAARRGAWEAAAPGTAAAPAGGS